jgi:DNA-binding transcriptional ArsR family regulator
MLRALAHPARLSILDALGTGQTGTATQFAEIVGLSPSATSYHLRALAKYGLVEEAPSRGDGRERVWQRKAGAGSFMYDPGRDDPPELWEAGRMLVDAVLARDDALIRRWADSASSDDPEWSHAARISRAQLLVTADELDKLNEAVDELMKPYLVIGRSDPPEGARPVAVNYRTFPIDRLAPPDVKP